MRRALVPRVTISLIAFLLAGSVLALDPDRSVKQYTMRMWSLDEGFPQASANAIVQSPDGYLYVATFGGLVRFDGVRVTVVPGETCSNRLYSLEVGREGEIWVGTERSGLCRVVNGVLEAFPAPDGNEVGGVSTIRQARDGSMWVGSVSGLLHISDRGFRRFTTEDGLPSTGVTAIDEAADGVLWIGTQKGVCLFQDGRCETPSWLAVSGEQEVEAIRHGGDGQIWIGVRGALLVAERERLTKIALPESTRVRAILVDGDGNVWVGLEPGGLVRVSTRADGWRLESGVMTDVVAALLEDRERNLWVGFSGTGLARLSDGRAIGLRLPDDRTSVPVLPIAPDGKGGIWVGTACSGLAHVSASGVIRMFDTDEGLGNLCVWSLLPDSSGGLWIGTHGNGLFRMRRDESIEARHGPLTREQVVRALDADEDGRVLVGTDQGLFRHDPDAGGFELVEGTEGADVYMVDRAEDGAIWVGTREGVLIVGPSGVTRLDRSTGLSNDHVRAIYREPGGVVWLGTYGGGLNRLEGERVTAFDSHNGLPDDVVSLIVEDSSGRFWLSGNRGVTRVAKSELEEVAGGTATRVTAELYDAQDGMPASETNGGGQPAGCLLDDGHLWIPTVDGVAIFDTRREISNMIPPPVLIEEVLVDGELIDLRREVVLPPGARNLEIHYTALSFRSSRRVRFKYRLEGFDERWIDAGTRRVAYYPVIPAGSLRFHVIASNDDGVWNEEGARFDFEMKPRFVATPWFFALCAIAAGLLVSAASWLRGFTVRRTRETLKREVELRTAELARLADLTERINQAVTIEDVLDHVYDSLRTVIPYDRIGLALMDENRVVLRAVWSRSESDTVGIGKGYEAPLIGSSLMDVLESGKPRVIADLEAYFAGNPESESTRRILSEGVRSSMTCPLKALGHPVGFLFFSSFKTHTYDESHVRFLEQIAGHLSLVVGKSKLYEDLLETKSRLEEANRNLEALAAADGLTGIANRRSFDIRIAEEWRRAIRAQTPLSLLLIDVDFFKPYNDRYGHTVGDDCLRTVATVLSANLRRVADTVARFGGEEFAVVLPETDEPSAKMMAERLRQAVEGLQMRHDASSVADVVTISVGGATVIPTTLIELAALIQSADEMLYHAKRGGRNRTSHRNLEAERSS